jgi:hypothetical protein
LVVLILFLHFLNCRIITSNPPTFYRPKQIRAGEYAVGRKILLERVNNSIYRHGTGTFYNSLNRLLVEVLGCGPVKILKIFFCKVKVFPHLEELSKNNYFLFYNRMKEFIVN